MIRAFSRALLLAAFCALACNDDSGPSSPRSCSRNLSGTYNGVFANSCGFGGGGQIVVAQSGCNFTAVLPGLGGATIEGTIESETRARFTGRFTSPCGGSFSGTATLSGNAVNGTWSGTISGPSGCGCGQNISGSFTLTR